MFATFFEAGGQGINRRALVPGGLVWSFELKRWHEASYRLLLYHEENEFGECITIDGLSIVMPDDAWSEGFSAQIVAAYPNEMRVGNLSRFRCESHEARATRDGCDDAERDDVPAALP